jgi:hypothetical protein
LEGNIRLRLIVCYYTAGNDVLLYTMRVGCKDKIREGSIEVCQVRLDIRARDERLSERCALFCSFGLAEWIQKNEANVVGIVSIIEIVLKQ